MTGVQDCVAKRVKMSQAKVGGLEIVSAFMLTHHSRRKVALGPCGTPELFIIPCLGN